MGKEIHLSERQLQLIQGAASILIDGLYLSRQEAMTIIAESLKEELNSSGTTFEHLEINTKTFRIPFIRNLVYRVQKKLDANRSLHKEKVRTAINAFVQLLHESWEKEEKT
jgi:hypothetical protein